MIPVKFENITHYYQKTAALAGLSFDIPENRITSVIGKSGSGKSTLIQIINGLILPTQGDVFLFGEKLDHSRINELRLQIGYSVQGTGLFPHMTVYDNIALLGKIARKPAHETERRIDYLMSLVDLKPEFKIKYPHQLSGGEQQRVGICRAMILDQKLFLLDEPFGALDPSTRNEIHAELLKLQSIEPRTIIMVTHDINEALKLGDMIMILEGGKLLQYGAKDDVVRSPANDFVKDFIDRQFSGGGDK